MEVHHIFHVFNNYFKISSRANNCEADPDKSDAYCAVIHAVIINCDSFESIINTLIHDVEPFSLGIEADDETVKIFIPNNTTTPAKSQQLFQQQKIINAFIQSKFTKSNRLKR